MKRVRQAPFWSLYMIEINERLFWLYFGLSSEKMRICVFHIEKKKNDEFASAIFAKNLSTLYAFGAESK